MKKRILTKVVAGIFGVGLLVGCESATQTSTGTHSNSDTVKIGGIFALSGSTAAYGIVEDQGTRLAIDQQNKAGGINDKKIEYIQYDNKGQPEETATGATYLTQQNVSAILGPDTAQNTVAAIPVIESAHVPLISVTTTVDNATIDKNTGKVYDYFFRTCFEISFQGGAIAEFANQKGWQRAAIIKDNATDYGQNLANVFKKDFKGKTVIEESYVSGDTDFQSILSNVKNQNPDVIFIAGYYQEAGTIIKQAREMGITAPIVGSNALGNQKLIDLAGKENMNSVYYVAHFVYTENAPQKVKDFVHAYKEAYGTEPDMFSALAYDAANLLINAVERADSTDPEKVRDAIAETKDFEGICYDYTFDANHNVKAPAFIQEIMNGEATDNVTRIDAN